MLLKSNKLRYKYGGINHSKNPGKGYGKGQKKQSTKNAKNTSNTKFHKEEEKWKREPTKPGETNVKQAMGKKFHWCIVHMA